MHCASHPVKRQATATVVLAGAMGLGEALVIFDCRLCECGRLLVRRGGSKRACR
jgi:hypothetical protein